MSIPESNKFDIITCSQELKKLIQGRLAELRVSLFKLCEQLDFKYEHVRLWMNIADPINNNQRLKQWQVIRLADSLGIDIRVTIVIKPTKTAWAKVYNPKDGKYDKQSADNQ